MQDALASWDDEAFCTPSAVNVNWFSSAPTCGAGVDTRLAYTPCIPIVRKYGIDLVEVSIFGHYPSSLILMRCAADVKHP
jgi:hypothetical protein